MAFPSALRLSTILRLSPFAPSRLPWLCQTPSSDLRFLSVSSRRLSRRPVAPVQARRREEAAAAAQDGNGSVMVKDSGSDGRIVLTELHKEATEAYMAYAMSVLLGRALPDVRDGLKPVHRRILFAMHELGLSSKKPFKKCARVVGEVLGKFHPHGDSAVYDSLVRMAQDFSLRCPLIQGHGNFGSVDADPPAAMRYTECRLECWIATTLLRLPDCHCHLCPTIAVIGPLLPSLLDHHVCLGSPTLGHRTVITASGLPCHRSSFLNDNSCCSLGHFGFCHFHWHQLAGGGGGGTVEESASYCIWSCIFVLYVVVGLVFLHELTEAMLLADIEQDTVGHLCSFSPVDFVPNFDNSQKEPSLLPSRLPTLLLNGSSGIAVGMATNIPPHNLGELVDVLCVLIHNPEATLQELLEYMPGPDFPTGGLIMGNLGILEAYRTGRGRVVVRGKTDIELLDSKTKRAAVIIKEIPYQTNKAALVGKIAELVENKNLDGISDIRDESDRSGMRIVIELKRGADPLIVLNNLYRLTSLQSTFSCNMVGILNGQPKQMGLKELLQVLGSVMMNGCSCPPQMSICHGLMGQKILGGDLYNFQAVAFIDFRCTVVERRARFKLSHAQARRHIVENYQHMLYWMKTSSLVNESDDMGILIGFDNLDRVIHIIRESSSNSIAAAALCNEFGLSGKQAEALMDISLRRLTLRESGNFVAESKSLMEQILKLEELLSSRKNILELIEQEAIELKNRFANPRRSTLEDTDNGQLEDIDIIPNEDMLLALSEKGYLKRMKPSTFNLQNRGTIGKSVGKLRVNDSMSDFLVCRAHDHVLYFSDKGTVYSARAYKVPECSRTAAGTPLVQILSLSDGGRITSIIPVSEFAEDQFLLMLTMQGYIKKVPLNAFSSIRSTGIIAIQLVPGDELKWVRRCTNDDVVAMASHNGMIRTLGRSTRGALAMRLKEGDRMASVDIIPAALWNDMENSSKFPGSNAKSQKGPWLLFVSESGYGKRVPLSSFRISPLNRVGLIGYKFAAEDRLAAVFVVGFTLAEDGESDEQVVLVSQSGTVNRIKVRDISIQSRFARGVILMRLDHAGKIQSASLISATDCEPDEVLAITQS
uniref:DNA topoisomerase (ATP-hydrolyzing) n=1 Tax=Arachis duranensis TaxID=130453 RepID=N1NJR9_ARADU|nr:putative gyrase protein [Arachis duranensis]